MGRMNPGAALAQRLTLAAAVVLVAGFAQASPARAAGIVVNTNLDVIAADGQCSLREAIINANNNAATHADCAAGGGADVITFSGVVAPIALTGTLPAVTDPAGLQVDGGAGAATVFGGGLHGAWKIEAGQTEVRNLHFMKNKGVNGGAMFVRAPATLTVKDSIFTENEATGVGGALINLDAALLRVQTSALNGNTAFEGGAIFSQSPGAVEVSASTFASNVAAASGGAIGATNGSVSLINATTFSGNVGFQGGALAVGFAATATIDGGSMTGNGATFGGAVHLTGTGNVAITGTAFSNNIAVTSGGAIRQEAGTTVTVDGGSFTNNTASGFGGGISSQGEALTVKGSSLSGNKAISGNGGGISSSATVFTLQDTLVNANQATAGGGLSAVGGLTAVERVTFEGNTATNTGGGLYTAGAGVQVSGTTFTGNTSLIDCGGASVGSGTLIQRSTFTGNSAEGDAGLCVDGAVTIVNSTISGNTATATSGGGIGGSLAGFSLLHSTVTNNTAAVSGGGIRNGVGMTVITGNSIIAGNTAPASPNCQGMTGLGANLVSNLAGCPVIGTLPTVGSPTLGPLARNGGSTQTRALLPGSLGIGAGDPAVCTAASILGVDQRAVARPQGPACDLGAYEGETKGGRDLTITADGLPEFTWKAGNVQNAYTLIQVPAAGGPALSTPLPGHAVSHADAAALPGAAYCYVLLPSDGGGLVGISDIECSQTGFMAGSVAPPGFSLILEQSSTATLSWKEPPGGVDGYLLLAVPVSGAPFSVINIPAADNKFGHDTGGAEYCYLLFGIKAGGVGNTNLLCAVPGSSTLATQAKQKAGATAASVAGDIAARIQGMADIARIAREFALR